MDNDELLYTRISDRVASPEEIFEALKKKDKEIEELKEYMEHMEHNYTVAINETVSKQKIKDKIEELRKRKSRNKFEFACKLKGILYLQELLEENE